MYGRITEIITEVIDGRMVKSPNVVDEVTPKVLPLSAPLSGNLINTRKYVIYYIRTTCKGNVTI